MFNVRCFRFIRVRCMKRNDGYRRLKKRWLASILVLAAFTASPVWFYNVMIDIRPKVKRPMLDAVALKIVEDLKGRLREHVQALASEIGVRNIFVPDSLDDKPHTQKYPPPLSFFYPDRGNFIAIVGNLGSKNLVRAFTRNFMSSTDFPVECTAVFGFIPGIGWSDHSSFWRYKYPTIMITDTAPFRYPFYHLSSDTPDKIDYQSLARVTHGLYEAILKMVE